MYAMRLSGEPPEKLIGPFTYNNKRERSQDMWVSKIWAVLVT